MKNVNFKFWVEEYQMEVFLKKLELLNIEIVNIFKQDLLKSQIALFEFKNNKMYVVNDVNIFNNLPAELKYPDCIINIPHIDIENQLSKMINDNIYYVTAFDEEEDEYWLFKYKQNDSLLITSCSGHAGCFKDKECVYNNKYCRTVMENHEINFIREATPEEIELFEKTVQNKINNNNHE